MNLKLVYRALRMISDWTVDGFFSEVCVIGTENLTKDGPVIIASTHPNEIIDVAALAVTIPHRRHLSFWGKSPLFNNILFRHILLSSGAIPVHRNPNKDDTSSKTALFMSSTDALVSGQVIGVFPEGASYTEPTIVQIMSGTAWAAVEYTRWRRQQREDGKAVQIDLVIVPVGLVYTEKATFDSRLLVHYGTPISMADYAEELDPVYDDEVAYRVVHKITDRIEKELFSITINASDWETLYAAETLRAIVYQDDRNVPLQDWVSVSQRFVDLLSDPTDKRVVDAKESLIKYYSLLHYTGLTHSLLPSIPSSSSRLRYLFHIIFPSLSTMILSPLYALTLILHVPGCITGELTLKLLSKKAEPESFSQYRAIGGGFGVGMAIATMLVNVKWEWFLPQRYVSLWYGTLAYLIGGWTMARWYGSLAPGLHRRLRQALASYRVLLGVLLPGSSELDITPYKKLPPPPPSNAYIRRHGHTSAQFWDKKEKEMKRQAPARVAGRKLVRALLRQREETRRVVDRLDLE